MTNTKQIVFFGQILKKFTVIFLLKNLYLPNFPQVLILIKEITYHLSETDIISKIGAAMTEFSKFRKIPVLLCITFW